MDSVILKTGVMTENAENSALHHINKLHIYKNKKNIKIENCYFRL